MPPEVALFVAAAYLSIYTFLCSLSCGAALVQLFPRLGPEQPDTFALKPEWEFSNIFLVFGLTTAIVFFGNAMSALGGMALYILIALAAMVVLRVMMVLIIHVVKPTRGLHVGNSLFVLVSFSVPLLLAHLGIYLFSGVPFWESASGWAVMAATLIGVTAIGLVPPLKVYGSDQYRVLSTMVYLFALGPIVLAWSNMPYLIYKDITITEAFSAPLFGDLILVTLILALPIAIIGFPQIARVLSPKKT